MPDIDVAELKRLWGRRATAIRDGLVAMVRVRPGRLDWAAAVVQLLPLAPQKADVKLALIRDLHDAHRQWSELDRRLEALSERLKELPVKNVLLK